MTATWIVFLAVLALWTSGEGGVASAASWSRSQALDRRGDVMLYWTPGVHDITFEVQARTLGYVAIGFSPDGKMPRSDMAVGWVVNGNATLKDMYATGRSEPIPDDQQDYKLMWGYENDTHTVLRFRRKYDTCDKRDLRITNDTIRVIYAFHPEDPLREKIIYHGHTMRGSQSIYLLERPRPVPEIDSSILTWELRHPGITISSNETMYWCKIFKVPPIETKHHVIGFQPVLDNSDLVHHIFLYECRVPHSAAFYEAYVGVPGHECYTSAMPKHYSHCSTILIAWGAGATGEFTPLNVGYSLGEANNGANYYMLEVHYENSMRKIGLTDTSGLRVFYTPHLRQYEASVVNIAHVVSPLQIIPPAQETFVSVGHCSEHCTRQLIPTNGIWIFSVFAHAHSLARGIKLRHIRRGTELPPIIEEQNYDSSYLQSRLLPQPVQVFPGDHLLLECNYDSTGQQKTTVGGLSLQREMCVAFAHYYPRSGLSECQSWPAIHVLTDWFNIKLGQQMNDFVVEESPDLPNQSLVSFLERFNWEGRSAAYQREIRYGQYMPFCLMQGRFPIQLNVTVEEYPTISNPYYVLNAKCTINQSVSQETVTLHPPSFASASATQQESVTHIVTWQSSSVDQSQRQSMVPETPRDLDTSGRDWLSRPFSDDPRLVTKSSSPNTMVDSTTTTKRTSNVFFFERNDRLNGAVRDNSCWNLVQMLTFVNMVLVFLYT